VKKKQKEEEKRQEELNEFEDGLKDLWTHDGYTNSIICSICYEWMRSLRKTMQ
jgi:hypothetical protein